MSHRLVLSSLAVIAGLGLAFIGTVIDMYNDFGQQTAHSAPALQRSGCIYSAGDFVPNIVYPSHEQYVAVLRRTEVRGEDPAYEATFFEGRWTSSEKTMVNLDDDEKKGGLSIGLIGCESADVAFARFIEWQRLKGVKITTWRYAKEVFVPMDGGEWLPSYPDRDGLNCWGDRMIHSSHRKGEIVVPYNGAEILFAYNDGIDFALTDGRPFVVLRDHTYVSHWGDGPSNLCTIEDARGATMQNVSETIFRQKYLPGEALLAVQTLFRIFLPLNLEDQDLDRIPLPDDSILSVEPQPDPNNYRPLPVEIFSGE